MIKRGEIWYADFRDVHGIKRRLKAFRDKAPSAEFERNLRALSDCVQVHERPDLELRRWVHGLPAKTREKLRRYGLIEAEQVAAGRTIEEHIAEWRESLLARGRTRAHAAQESSRVKKVLAQAGFKTASEIDGPRLERTLARMQEEEALSTRTRNARLGACKAFVNWLVSNGRLAENRLACLRPAEGEAKVKRRVLSDEELRRFLKAAAEGPEFRGMSGAEWALLFRLAVETGLRWSALRSLTRASFQLEADIATVSLAKEANKSRRSSSCPEFHVLPLKAGTVVLLQEHLRLKLPTARAFNVPKGNCGAKAIRFYLERTGDADREIDPIPYKDAAGRQFDFHALRAQFGTSLARAGVGLAAAQKMMGHSNPQLTAKHYTLQGLEDFSAAVDKLPDLDAMAGDEAAAKTGTDDHTGGKSCTPSCTPQDGFSLTRPDGIGHPGMKKAAGAESLNSALAHEKGPENASRVDSGPGVSGGTDETRTRNHRIDSPVL